jgi:hypothetical protein
MTTAEATARADALAKRAVTLALDHGIEKSHPAVWAALQKAARAASTAETIARVAEDEAEVEPLWVSMERESIETFMKENIR